MARKSTKSAVVAGAAAEMPAVAPPPSLYPTVSLESLAGLGCANLAALTRANLALSQGMQAIGQEMLRCTQSAFENAGRTATAFLGGHALDAVFQLGTELAAVSFDAVLTRSAKFAEIGAGLAETAVAPAAAGEAAIVRLARSRPA